jgi:hypothetical protein
VRKGVVEESAKTRARQAYRAAVVGVIEPAIIRIQTKRQRRISPATAAPRFSPHGARADAALCAWRLPLSLWWRIGLIIRVSRDEGRVGLA